MADTRQNQPVVPAPPRPQDNRLDIGYFTQLYRWLESLVRYMNGTNYGRFNALYLPGMAQTGYGLIPGEVFINGGILTVVQPDDVWIGPLTTVGEVGIVTVTV